MVSKNHILRSHINQNAEREDGFVVVFRTDIEGETDYGFAERLREEIVSYFRDQHRLDPTFTIKAQAADDGEHTYFFLLFQEEETDGEPIKLAPSEKKEKGAPDLDKETISRMVGALK